MAKNYSFEIYEFDEALTEYGTIETRPPERATLVIDDFTQGTHFRTTPEPETNALTLSLDNRLLGILLDESGSMSWNDANQDRFTYLKRLLSKLDSTYPGQIVGNLIGFGGVPTTAHLIVTEAGSNFLTNQNQDFDQFQQDVFQNSVYDFAGVRVVRRTDRFPAHPADGVIVGEGIFESIKDENLIEGTTYYYGIWTYNKDFHFSSGQFVRGIPRDRLLPRGVNYAIAQARILPGVIRDAYTEIIYNFTERSGSTIYDSSGNAKHGTLGDEVVDESFWTGDATRETAIAEYRPVGVRFDGEFDIIETSIDDSVAWVQGTREITVNFWIYRYSTEDQWIIGTSTTEATNSIGWSIGIEGGSLAIAYGDLSAWSESTSLTLDEKTWTMVTVVFGDSDIRTYKNSTLVDTIPVAGVDTSGFDSLYIGAKPTSSGATWFGRDFFGSLAQVSIHSTARDQDYIIDLFLTESAIFEQTWNQKTKPDNLQREVLIRWDVNPGYDYENGEIRVVRKYRELPWHAEDGDLVGVFSAEPGQYEYIDSFDFIHNSDYYYRIFTINSLGNACDLLESRSIAVHIPSSIVSDTDLLPVSNESISLGNRKTYIQWENPDDAQWRGTRVYWSDTGYPSISISAVGSLVVSNGHELIDTTGSSVVHRLQSQDGDIQRPLSNGTTYYYTIVAYDEFNKISEAKYLSGIPSSQLETVFTPERVKSVHLTVLNPTSLSVQWKNPTVKSENLELYMGDRALCFVSVRDVYGGSLTDITNLKLLVSTSFTSRNLSTSERPLGASGDPTYTNGETGTGLSGTSITPNTPGSPEDLETVLTYADVESGLIKGLLGHTNDKNTLSQRSKYEMNVFAQYLVKDSETDKSLFEFNTRGVHVTFKHPIEISLVNQLGKFVTINTTTEGAWRGDDPCTCPEDGNDGASEPKGMNGGYINATQPYICRVEMQYKGESFPAGTPVFVELYEHNDDPSQKFTTKSTKTIVREGRYSSSPIEEEELDNFGDPTGRIIKKSIVDIEITHPNEPDNVDILVKVDFNNFVVRASQQVVFISSLFISADIYAPNPDGVDVAEQFANVWMVHPDYPDDPTRNIPVPDGTLVKWELERGQFGKQRPFYSTDPISQNLSGVYSTITSGVARHVFFGPIGDIEPHVITKTCEDGPEECCVGEDYRIKASVIFFGQSRWDGKKFDYPCEIVRFANRRFLMNAAPETPGSDPHYITWADGEHLLKFQIAKNPAISTIKGADCFRACVEQQVGGQLFPFADGQIVQVVGDCEILWNVTFAEQDSSGQSGQETGAAITATPIEFESAAAGQVANIPILSETTDFYCRLNRFVGDGVTPQPDPCENAEGGGGLGGSDDLLPCEWKGVCENTGSCSPTEGRKWLNVSPLQGQATLIFQNKEVTLFGGGAYEDGIPPIYTGFKEPLDVRIIEARVNGERVEQLQVDNVSIHTFVVEARFANEPVPDGTPIEITVSGTNQSVVILSNCVNTDATCYPTQSGTVYTRLTNDPLINPNGAKRALAYFSIDPLPNVAFYAQINVTCRYDKLGTATRIISRCIDINNTVEAPPSEEDEQAPGTLPEEVPAAVSNQSVVYDTVEDVYASTRASLVRRMAHSAISVSEGTADKIYVFGGHVGGTNNQSPDLTPRCEVFDPTNQTWDYITDMPTPRASTMAVLVGSNIYVIGGIEQDPIFDEYRVSRKVEMYQTASGLWNESLTDMPEGYGVAFGAAYYAKDYIYITSGIKSMVNSSQAKELNDKILRYSISAEEAGDYPWTVLDPSNSDMFARIAPFYFNRQAVLESSETATEDVYSDLSTIFDDSGMTVGNSSNGYIQFTLELPHDAVISSAMLNLTAAAGPAGTITISVEALSDPDIDNLAGYTAAQLDEHGHVGYATQLTHTWVGGSSRQIEVGPTINRWLQSVDYEPNKFLVLRLNGEGSSTTVNFETINSGTPSTLNITYVRSEFYVYGGSVPKSSEQIQSERQEEVNRLLDDFRSMILTSPYYQNMTDSEQTEFVKNEERRIREGVEISPFLYPASGYKFYPYLESTTVDIGDTLENEWAVVPAPRDRGVAVYIPHQDIAYFIGGSNHNTSTTLNRVESIDFGSGNMYERRTPLNQGRCLFAATYVGDDIYFNGGLNSGHRPGWTQISVETSPKEVQAMGTQSAGILVSLRNDSGELVAGQVRCAIRGFLRIPALDDILVEFFAKRAADRALGGSGAGDAPDLPSEGDELDVDRLIKAQNKITDPNSDEFQFNAARKLNEEVYLFPILYSDQEITVVNGVGGAVLLPRSEDPLTDLSKLGQFIETILTNTPEDSDERFQGDLTREELAALGDVLKTIEVPTTVLESGAKRDLYQIETQITLLDSFWFGQSVSEYDLNVQEEIQSRIVEKLTPPTPADDDSSGSAGTDGTSTGTAIKKSKCFVLQHLAQSTIPPSDTPASGPGSAGLGYPGGTNQPSQTGQCLFCDTLLPKSPSIRNQLVPQMVTFFQITDWLPQVRKYLATNDSSLSDIIDTLNTLDHETPFGGSQLYNALYTAGTIMGGDSLDSLKKSIYIVSDNSQNLSMLDRQVAIDEVNAVDGDKKVPCIYTVFSTSFPTSLAAQLDRSEVGDVDKITKETGGQSSTLISSSFLDQILNLTIGGATGGLGYGIYSRQINLGELSAVTEMSLQYDLPINTQGYIRFRYSEDGYNFGDWSERYEGSQIVDFTDFFAKVIEIEIVLTTGFVVDLTEEYDNSATGIPRLLSLTWEISGEREDFVYLNKESLLTNAAQVAVAFEGTVPTSSIVEIAAATSNSHDWQDYQSPAQPAVREFGKIFILDRTKDPNSLVPDEQLFTVDYMVYKATYGAWNPQSSVDVFEINSDDEEIPVLGGYIAYPRTGEIHFDTRQDPSKIFKIRVTNSGDLRIGLRLRNRLHEESITMHGAGYIYTSNDIRPTEISQVAPRAINAAVSPSAPTSKDTFYALYDYVDLNNDAESGTIISWYKNGMQLLEIQNRSYWTNDDLLPSNKLQPDDQINFSVIPSDGRDYGATTFAPSVAVQAIPPGLSDLRIVPYRNNIVNNRFDTSSVFKVEYDFETDETGSASFEDGTVIKWFINGLLFKDGVYSEIEQDASYDPKSIQPGEIRAGATAHFIGNQVYVEVTPKTIKIQGSTERSGTITVENSVPKATDVIVSPLKPTKQSTLTLTYNIDDQDVTNGVQTDQSSKRWYMSPNGTTYTEITSLRNAVTVASSVLNVGEYWYAEVTPDDGLDLGAVVKSNIVVIQA